MTIGEVIAWVDRHKPNTVDRRDKIRWLSELDQRLELAVLQRYEGAKETALPYTEETREDQVLVIEPPFDVAYHYWLESKIDYESGEIDQYNNSSAMFENALDEWRRWYVRTHRAAERHMTYF